jgi:hypothetical protein
VERTVGLWEVGFSCSYLFIAALMALLKATSEDTEDVSYNVGIIDAIKTIEKIAVSDPQEISRRPKPSN